MVTAPQRRLWPRFTLRVLLVFVTIVGIGLGYWTHRAREQRLAVHQITAGRGYVVYDYQFGQPANSANSPIPDVLIRLFGRDFFHSVQMARIESRDSIRAAARLPALEELEVAINGVSDDDVLLIAQMKALKALLLISPIDQMEPSQISDVSLRAIGEMPRLEMLDAMTGQISANGLGLLAQGPLLREIALTCPKNGLQAQAFAVLTTKRMVRSVVIEEYWDTPQAGRSFQTLLEWHR